MVDTLTYRVIYADTDQMGVMYYANYLRLFEAGRGEYMRKRGLTYKEVEGRGLFLPVTLAQCKYRKSARYDDLLTLKTKILSARGARVVFNFEIHNEKGELLAEGKTEHAFVDGEGRIQRLGKELIEALAPEEA